MASSHPTWRCSRGETRFFESKDEPGRWLCYHLPCHSKSTCLPCRADYLERVGSQIVEFGQSQCRLFAGLIPLDIAKSPHRTWKALQQRLYRRGVQWVAIPAEGHVLHVLVWTPTPDPLAVPVTNLTSTVRYLLDQHDVEKRITSPWGVNIAARDEPKWYIRGSSRQGVERVARAVIEVGLTPEWNGVDCFFVRNATKELMDEVMGKVAA